MRSCFEIIKNLFNFLKKFFYDNNFKTTSEKPLSLCKYFAVMRKILICILMSAVMFSCAPRDRYMTVTGFAQGGAYTVKFNMNGPEGMVRVKPEVIRDSIDAILRNIDASVSGYNKNSLLSRFNAGETIVPDDVFIDIYHSAYGIYEETGGIVDVASAPLFDIWGFGFANGSMPSPDEVASALAVSGMKRLVRRIEADSEGRLNARDILVSGEVLPKLNYNAIAQGYSCDLVADYLYSIGVRDMMVDIGEIFCDGRNPSGQPWSLGIDRPVDGNNDPGVNLQGVFRAPEGPHGIVTSGNYRKFYVRDGKKYAHTIDPRTGCPVSHNLLSATIVAPDAMTADAYATYCMVIGLEASQDFLASRPDLEGCLIYDAGGSFATWCSDGFLLETLE